MDIAELVSALRENLRISLAETGDYEGRYLEVKLFWNRGEITSDSINLDNFKCG
jgi:hypothetical protein